jgi:YD repeat-containing protein
MGTTERYIYDIAGKLAKYVKPSGAAVSYDYDKLNNRVFQISKATMILQRL